MPSAGQIAEMTYAIRSIEAGDYARLPEIFRDAITSIGRHHYTDDQIRVWLARAPSASVFADAFEDGRLGFVVEGEGGEAVGFADLAPDGHINWFYCHPVLSGTGMADRLLFAVEGAARAKRIRCLSVEASETARSLFLRNGFEEERRRGFEIDGVAIHNYAMSKGLE